MTCRKRQSRFFQKHRAYTFLEVAISLGLIAIIFAAVFPMVSASFDERQLRQTMDEISQVVGESRREAEVSGREQNLIITSKGLAAREKDQERVLAKFPGGISVDVKYPQGDWEAAREQDWRIFAFGVVQPLAIRLRKNARWIEADFDFLTGSIASEKYSF